MSANYRSLSLGPHRFTIVRRRPTFADRLYFAWEHRSCCPVSAVLAVIFGRATGVRHRSADVLGFDTFFVNRGFWKNRRERKRIIRSMYGVRP